MERITLTDTTDLATTEDMTAEEGQRLLVLEREVEKAMRSAGRIAGAALKEIKDQRLYRASHRSFERYVLDRHGLSASTAYRMMQPAEDNGLPPAVAAIGAASARAAERRHETLDQPPAVIEPRHEPLERRSEDEEAPRRPRTPKPPPEPFPEVKAPCSPPPQPERRAKMQARDHMNRIMQVLDQCDDKAVAQASTTTERLRIARFAVIVAAVDRGPVEQVATPGNCDHPITRKLGKGCGKCGDQRAHK
jgi:hypothetical protein